MTELFCRTLRYGRAMSDAPVAPGFDLPNEGAGRDPVELSRLAVEYDFVALFFQRDPDCHRCRRQVKAIRDRYDGFRARDAVAVAVLPAGRDRAAEWQAEFDLPYPLAADPEGAVAADYDQTVRLAALAEYTDSDYVGRLPRVVVADTRRRDPGVAWTHQGTSAFDRPSTGDVLEAIDESRD